VTPEQAAAIYDILVDRAGADPGDGDAFIYHLTDGCTEWRFRGHLGFGGKLYVEPRGWRVGAYPEDMTPARAETIRVANAALDGCHAAFVALEKALED
jgi:hypothetical protein